MRLMRLTTFPPAVGLIKGLESYNLRLQQELNMAQTEITNLRSFVVILDAGSKLMWSSTNAELVHALTQATRAVSGSQPRIS